MQKTLVNILYTAFLLGAFAFAAYAPTFSAKATSDASLNLYAQGDEIYGYVVAVMDGDTIKVRTADDRELRVRLAGIDAPEKEQSYGEAARKSLSDLAYNKPAGVLVMGTDSTGRILGRVFIGTLDLNVTQIGRGLAWVDPNSPNKDERFVAAETRARRGQVGLWVEKNAIPPWEFRKREG